MQRLKILISLFLGLAVIFGQAGAVHAAPPHQEDASITGTVESVVVETNLESGQTVVVTLLVNDASQTIRISIETAIELGLFALDEDGNPVVDEDGIPVVDDAIIGTDVQVDPETILPDEPVAEEEEHPVGEKIAGFFSGLLDADYELIMSSHSGGFGFGVLTQALWITHKLGGDATLFQTILDARENNDYSLVELPVGNIPQNWGQFRKAALKGEDDQNLGDIVSGKKDESGNSGNGGGQPDDPGNGNGKPENPGNGNGNSGDPETGKPDDPGNGNGRLENIGTGTGNSENSANRNKPENPPGQTKDKTKDKTKENTGNGKKK